MNGKEIKDILMRKFGIPYAEWSNEQKCILANAVYDCSIGRYSKFLMWSPEKIDKFFEYCVEVEEDYFNADDAVRWALEDSFDMN